MKNSKKSENRQSSPRIGVFVCNCGINIAGFLDTKDVAEYARTLPNVVFVRENLYSCSEAGVRDIKQAIVDNKLERVVVAACTPITHEPTFRAACEEAGLNAYYFEFVNIREHCSWVHKDSRQEATQKAKDLIRMGVARVAYLEPMEPIVGKVTRRGLIIGGGVSGMTAALELSSRGFDVVLVEKEKTLGGLLRALNEIYPWGIRADEYLAQLRKRVKASKRIEVLTSTEITNVKGYVGNYDVELSTVEDPIRVGVIIVATGASPLVPEGIHGYNRKTTISMYELEVMLKQGRSPGKRVIIIGCAGVRSDERLYCSRICCMTAIKNALFLRKHHKCDVTMLYRDLMCYGTQNEEILMEAKKAGVRFVNFSEKQPPVVGDSCVKVNAAILGREIELPYDLVVLTSALVPAESNRILSRMLKVPVDEYGFFLEAHIKLRPLDFATDGIFVCGTSRWPASISECLEQSIGAASRASTFLATGSVRVEPIVSVVDPEKCRGCGLCVGVCPYGGIELVETDQGTKARTIEVACKGCGTCGATCYRGAITMRHYTNEQMFAQIRAAFTKE